MSIGVLSVPPLVGFPCRCGFRCAFRGGALWRCLSRYLFCACYGVTHTTYLHITYLLSGGRWRCCCLCVFFMHDIQHTWVHVRPLALFVVIPFARISYMSGLALLGRVLVVYLHRGAVRYLFILPVYLFPRCVCFVGFSRCAAHNILACRRPVALLLSMCGLFWGAHKSLAPRARTLLGGLGQATLSFFAVATLLFVFFGVCPIFCDLAKQRRKIVGGVSEAGKDDFSLYFCWRCVFFSYFYFSAAAIARHTFGDSFLKYSSTQVPSTETSTTPAG